MSIIDSSNSVSWNYANANVEKSGKAKIINCLLSFPLYNRDNSKSYLVSKHIDFRYFTVEYGINENEILKLLKCQLEDLIQLLKIYLVNSVDIKKDITKKSQIASINPKYVISFNYTDTYKIYGIKPKDVFHVHGSLDKDNMVLGFNDDDEKNLDFIYFKKYFQRIQKLTGYIDKNRVVSSDVKGFPEYPIIHFYGHSMDKTDGDIIQKLCSMASGFVIYKYDQEDYEQKVINLIDIFGKEQATQMIQTGFIKFVQCEK